MGGTALPTRNTGESHNLFISVTRLQGCDARGDGEPLGSAELAIVKWPQGVTSCSIS